MKEDSNANKLFITLEFISICSIKFFFLISAIYSFFSNANVGHYTRSKFKWTNTFFIKILLNLIICFNYLSLSLQTIYELKQQKRDFLFIFIVNSYIWFISFCLTYFEYVRKIPHQWFGLRAFWLLNGAYNVIKINILFVHDVSDKCIFSNVCDKDELDLKLLMFYCIQFIFETFILILGILQIKDSPQENILRIINKDIIPGGLYDDNNIELNIAVIKTNKYIRNEQNELVVVGNNINQYDPNVMKLRFNFKVAKGKHFLIKKTLQEVITFNNQEYKNYISKETNQDHNNFILSGIHCSLLMQLKNITSILSKKEPSTSKLKEISSLYINLLQKYEFFLDDFLMFCDITDPLIKSALQKAFTNEQARRSLISNENNNTNTILSQINNLMVTAPQETNDNINHNIIDNNMNIKLLEENDIVKTINFLMKILTTSNNLAVKFKIVALNEKHNLIESSITCEISLDDKPYNENITIEIKELYDYIKHSGKCINSAKTSKIKKMLKDSQIMNLRYKNSSERSNFEKTFNTLINDIFYIDSDIINIFGINKLINLESDEIDTDMINTFFEMENDIYLNTLYINSIYSQGNNIKLTIDNIVVNENEMNICLNINVRSNEQEDKVIKSWKTDFYLTKMLKECKVIKQINLQKKRFEGLNGLLGMIIELGEKMSEKGKEGVNENNDIDEFVELLNELFYKGNLYVFYSPFFRMMFNVGMYTNLPNNVVDNKNIMEVNKDETDNDNELNNYFKENAAGLNENEGINNKPSNEDNVKNVTANLLQNSEYKSMLENLLDYE